MISFALFIVFHQSIGPISNYRYYLFPDYRKRTYFLMIANNKKQLTVLFSEFELYFVMVLSTVLLK